MIIINADDWGRSAEETDITLSCYRAGRISSVSAMVFMADSQRAADLANEAGLDVGLHLNLSQTFNGSVPAAINEVHEPVVRFMSRSKYAVLLYQPFLRRHFRDTYKAQAEEFNRLYGRPPSHVDGHQHRHLCANMVLDDVIPTGQKVRRNFSFWPGEKSLLNRAFRRMMDKRLGRRYRLTDFFFSLGQCLKNGRLQRVAELARTSNVELMTHPVDTRECTYLKGDEHARMFSEIEMGSFTSSSRGQPSLSKG